MIYYRFSLGLFSLVAWHPASFYLMAHTYKRNETHFFIIAARHIIFLSQSLSVFLSLPLSLCLRRSLRCASLLRFPFRTLLPLQPLSFYYIYEWIFSWAVCSAIFLFPLSVQFFQFRNFWQEKWASETEGANNVWIKKLQQRNAEQKKLHHICIVRGAAMAMTAKCVRTYSLLSRARIRKWNFLLAHVQKFDVRLCVDHKILAKHKTWLNRNRKEFVLKMKWNGMVSYGSGITLNYYDIPGSHAQICLIIWYKENFP